ncbi:type II toxin-antitoxin system MqsA family antitoxin [Acidovorax sp. JG5]|uniref:type II toxin-antitoxin system MqsA family antitoxin n=1 Tax=Acidovorax sp. JG5 TaxID=2822718 RepID=UPI001B33DFE8|nr:type II toxin-antitoxin system MqsA family antitoxin [Acidovorax sp. JG5]MBP3981285.1 type II toxin-antitoxin system MqsA family antitoxin [Acidovorax sp. JG5]
MKCPVCGGAELIRDTRAIDAKGVQVVVTGDFCPSCGECILDHENGDRYGAVLKQARLVAAKRLAELGGAAPDMQDVPRRQSPE